MAYDELIQTDDLSETVPTKVNENFRRRAFLNDAAKTATFTVWTDDTTGVPIDIYLVTTGGSGVTANLPDVTVSGDDAYKGRVVTIMKVDAGAGAVTIDGNGSQTINGATTVALSTQWHFRTIVSNGVAWFVIGNN